MCMHDHHESAGPDPSPKDLDPFPWHIGVFDAHNHIGERVHSASDLPAMKSRSLAIMATRTQDQPLIEAIVKQHGVKGPECFSQDRTTVVAGYGRHPWFSHQIYDDSVENPTYVASDDIEEAKGRHYKAVLSPPPENPAWWHQEPVPLALSTFIAETRNRLLQDPFAMVGEIGLDKPFRLPTHWPDPRPERDPARTAGGRERRPLSQHRITIPHQKAVFMAHLKLAGELGRPVSVHGVQVHGLLYDALTESWKGHEVKGRRSRDKEKKANPNTSEEEAPKPYPPRICLHSFSGKSDAVKQYLKPSIPAKIFFSFSKANNLSFGAKEKTEDAVKAVPDNRILVESDLHTAGERMDDELEEMYRAICEVKGWGLEEGVKQIAENYKEFVFG
ncbi:Cut9-interacting protein scn1 [Fusarium equiseti]|uniref:Cut9-interacting protein scn1 n=1 Tax=Fusarium equiseti TaxID=61235 RepID=A0ABQ8R4H1_FUSEQ|nr:Cut9-interacting protein scn1 [Fusarium equiseti]